MKQVRIRRLRHWKQRYDKGAAFVWRRITLYSGKYYPPGSKVPKDIIDNPTKLRRFWESSRIELAEFDVPNVSTGEVKPDAKKVAAEKRKAKRKVKAAEKKEIDNLDDILS